MDGYKHRWLVVAAMSCALSLIFLDQTALSVALPSIQNDLHLDEITLHWIINAYLLALAAVIIFGGRVGDIFGHRQAFIGGLVVFMLASITCGFAENGWFAVTSRAIQGIGAAFMIPSSGVQIVKVFSDTERGTAIGVYVGVASMFLISGPFIGGFLSDVLSWRYIFWVNIPIGLASLLLTLRYSPKDKRQNATLDWKGFFFLSIGMVGLIFGLMHGGNHGWASPIIIFSFATSLLAMVLFYYSQINKKHPLVNFNLFKNKTFSLAVTLLMIIQMGFICVVLWAIFLQHGLGNNAFEAGIRLMPVMAPISFMAPLAGRILDRCGPRLPSTLGILCMLFGALVIGFTAPYYNYWYLLPGFIAFGFAAPLVISSGMTTVLNSMTIHQRGVAAGIANSGRQLGSALGLALFGSIIFNINKIELMKTHYLSTDELNHFLKGGQQAQQILEHLPPALHPHFEAAAKSAYTTGFQMAMFGVALVAMIGLLVARQLPNYPIKTDEKNLHES